MIVGCFLFVVCFFFGSSIASLIDTLSVIKAFCGTQMLEPTVIGRNSAPFVL